MKLIKPQKAKALSEQGREFALLDVREAGQFGEGHAFFAVNVPYSRLELDIAALVPLRGTRIALIDDGDGVAEQARRRLRRRGYMRVVAVAGGIPAWAAAGLGVFKGVHVPSKAFGELVEQVRDTPAIDAIELKDMAARGEPVTILDGRSPEEYEQMTIPGAVSCPNAELGLRIDALCPDMNTTVVVSCAGRTRSIIGAQSLIDLGLVDHGVVRRVVALRNGTMGWRLAGFDLDHGATRSYPAVLGARETAAARKRARDMAERDGIKHLGQEQLREWMGEDNRTTYVFDVRSAREYAEAHPPRAIHAPGGQLVQATDAWVAVRGARIVLVDHLEVRAVVTAHWLTRMGLEVYVLNGEDVQIISTVFATAMEESSPLIQLDAGLTAGAIAGGIACVDLRSSAEFRKAHIRESIWSIRPRLHELPLGDSPLGHSPLGRKVVLVVDDKRVAELAALDLAEQEVEVVGYLDSSPRLWPEGGLKVDSGRLPPERRIDYLFFVHDRHAGNMDAARAYLDWETGLVAAMDEQERAVFAP